MTIENLKPGFLVDATIVDIVDNGLCIRFLTDFEGTIFIDHLDKPLKSYRRK
jgi:hypothetical protein